MRNFITVTYAPFPYIIISFVWKLLLYIWIVDILQWLFIMENFGYFTLPRNVVTLFN